MNSFVYVLAVWFSICFTAQAADPAMLRIHGSNTIGSALVPELAKLWLTQRGYTRQSSEEIGSEELRIKAQRENGESILVEVYAHGSSTAFVDLGAGSADVGMASRPIKPEELGNLSKLGALDQPQCEYVLALDGVAIIVHPQNKLGELTKDKLRKIFTGKISNWSELGLPPGKIQIYARDDRSGTYDTFKSLVLNDAPLIATASRLESSVHLSDAVAHDPNAIGFVGLAYVHNAKRVAIADEDAKPLLPGPFNVATEDYVLSRRLYLYVPEYPSNPLAHDFADFAVSSAAESKIDEIGFISQAVKAVPQPLPKDAPGEFTQLTSGAQRLSMNIRFRPGSAKLDNKAARDLGRLVAYMARVENRTHKLMVFGFSDAHETSSYLSEAFSVNRADAVADYFIIAGIAPNRVRGFGDLFPVAGNNTEQGRHYNRRVEVWVR